MLVTLAVTAVLTRVTLPTVSFFCGVLIVSYLDDKLWLASFLPLYSFVISYTAGQIPFSL